jgi:squalene synthase HpnC
MPDATPTTAAASLETPSGKNAAYENFPVGSWLLPAALRPHVAVYYAFARAIDDIADNPELAPMDKVARLDAFARGVVGEPTAGPKPAKAEAMRRILDETGISARHCTDLVVAFKQDALKARYADWEELMDYCFKSAAPVGRFLLDLHGGSSRGYGPSDALCNALQVINHLQDCGEDYRELDRVYLPLDWMRAEDADVADLARSALTPALRRVVNRCLDGVDALLREARALPAGLASRRLAMESAAILEIAARLAARLRRQDPLAHRVALGKPAYVWCCVRGLVGLLVR